MDLFFILEDVTRFVYVMSVALILIMVFLERSDPRTIAFWTAVLLIVPLLSFVFPVVGYIFPITAFILYLLFGQTFYSKRQFALKNIGDGRIAEMTDRFCRNDITDGPEREFTMTILRSGGSACSGNNDVTLYTEGGPFFESFLRDLRNARSSIHIEFYIIRDDRLSNEFMDILIHKAETGVEVRLMIDAIGKNKGMMRRAKELREAGGEFALFHRIVTLLFSPKKNNRNHRKIAVIDGDIGYVAGFNIGDEYTGKGPFGRWRDSGVRIEGGGVAPIQMRFLMDWGYASGKQPDLSDRYFPADGDRGNDAVQLVSGGPDSKSNPIELQYLKIISSAERALYIHTPYLVPDRSTINALALAAYSGVDVRIMIPDRPDHLFVYWTSLWYANELMKRGVRIFRYHGGFVHSKTLVADARYCSVGSANLDLRSMNLNFETNSMICSERIGKEMEKAFFTDLEHATEYTPEEHAGMSAWNKFKMSVARLFGSLA